MSLRQAYAVVLVLLLADCKSCSGFFTAAPRCMRPVVCGSRSHAASPILRSQRGDDDVQLAQAREAALQEDSEWYQQFIAGDAGSSASQQPQQSEQPTRRRQRQQSETAEIDAGLPWQPPVVSEERRRAARMRSRQQDDEAVQRLAEAAVAEPVAAAVELTEEELLQLRALGYADAEAQTLTEDMRGLVLEREVRQRSCLLACSCYTTFL